MSRSAGKTQVAHIKRPLAPELIAQGGLDGNDMSLVAVAAIGPILPFGCAAARALRRRPDRL
jgi:hypothetical protein